jgi:hypothetical protein
MTNDDDLELGFCGKNGEFISFDDLAKKLPTKYENLDENGLPPLSEREVLSKEMRMYDLFQIVEVTEKEAGLEGKPDEAGWYWLTYFCDPSTGCALIGPFEREVDAIKDACSKALPINDPRRKESNFGFVGGGFRIQCIVGRIPGSQKALH